MHVRPFVLAGLLLAASASFAPGPARAWPRLRPGLELGVLSASASHPEGLTSFDSRWTAGFSGAYTVQVRLPAKLSFSTGLRYAREADRVSDDFGVIYTGGSGTLRWEGTTTFQRVGVPMRISAGLPYGRGLSLEAGVEPQFLLRADQSTDALPVLPYAAPASARGPARPAAIIFESLAGDGEVTGTLPRWNAVVSAGLGWESLASTPAVVLHGRWLQGVSDQTLSPYMKRYSRAAELAVGVRW